MQLISGKAERLVGILSDLEKTCDAIATFWTCQADNFDSQGAKMATNQAVMIKWMKSDTAKKNIAFWTKAKEELDTYSTMASIELDFVSKARLQQTNVYGLPTLALNLRIPANIDTRRI